MKKNIILLIACSLLLTSCTSYDTDNTALTETKNDIKVGIIEEVYC